MITKCIEEYAIQKLTAPQSPSLFQHFSFPIISSIRTVRAKRDVNESKKESGQRFVPPQQSHRVNEGNLTKTFDQIH